MSNHELKPCPFCGGEPSEREAGIGTAIRCRKCGSEQFARHRSGAVMLWEARVPPTQAEAMRCPEVIALVEAHRLNIELMLAVDVNGLDAEIMAAAILRAETAISALEQAARHD